MGRLVIVAYRPRPGQSEQLLSLMREHVPILREEGLATDRPPYLMRAKDGTLVEVFEWQSSEAIAFAHENPTVRALWQRYRKVSEYVPLANIAECADLFAEFEPIEC